MDTASLVERIAQFVESCAAGTGAPTLCYDIASAIRARFAPPADCDALGRPSFEERHAANEQALQEMAEMFGSKKEQ